MSIYYHHNQLLSIIYAIRSFWEARNQWLPTWNAATDDNAMQIDYIRVYAQL